MIEGIGFMLVGYSSSATYLLFNCLPFMSVLTCSWKVARDSLEFTSLMRLFESRNAEKELKGIFSRIVSYLKISLTPLRRP